MRAVSPLRWLVTALVVIGLIALGIVAGRWQYGRYEARASAVAAQEQAAALPQTTLAAALADAEPDAWRSVIVSGTLVDDSVTTLRGRSVSSTASLQYLAWLRADDGVVLVNLGWRPRTDDAPLVLPDGAVVVEGVARDMEPDDGRRDDGATRILPAQMPQPPGEPAPVWVAATAVCPVDGSGCLDQLAPVPTPSLGLGPHLSYSWQWWLLAAVALPGAVWLTLRDAAHADDSPARPRPRRRREPTDEEIEDALTG